MCIAGVVYKHVNIQEIRRYRGNGLGNLLLFAHIKQKGMYRHQVRKLILQFGKAVFAAAANNEPEVVIGKIAGGCPANSARSTGY